jgi:hypothetical protein
MKIFLWQRVKKPNPFVNTPQPLVRNNRKKKPKLLSLAIIPFKKTLSFLDLGHENIHLGEDK